jgi:hypothetical protein
MRTLYIAALLCLLAGNAQAQCNEKMTARREAEAKMAAIEDYASRADPKNQIMQRQAAQILRQARHGVIAAQKEEDKACKPPPRP